MKIAIATPTLYEKNSPFNHLFKDILGAFLGGGNEVVRLVAVRNKNEDAFSFGYNNIQYEKFVRKESAHSNIISRYLRDTLTTIREAKRLSRIKADVLFEDVSYSSKWTVKAAKKNGMRVVAMLQDVWPDNAVQSGLIRQSGLLYRFFEFQQRKVYQLADRIICISDDMKSFIESKGVRSSKIEVIYNWGYSDEVVSIPWEENEFVKKYHLNPDVFYAVYAGNIGKMQNVELIVKAARILKDEQNIHFLIVGDGARKNDIAEQVKNQENITLLPIQPSELATHIYAMAGVNLVTLVEGGLNTALPSKTGIVLASSRPVIFSFGMTGQWIRLIEEYHAGISVDANDENHLARAIKACRDSGKVSNPGAVLLFKTVFSKAKNTHAYDSIVSGETKGK